MKQPFSPLVWTSPQRRNYGCRSVSRKIQGELALIHYYEEWKTFLVHFAHVLIQQWNDLSDLHGASAAADRKKRDFYFQVKGIIWIISSGIIWGTYLQWNIFTALPYHQKVFSAGKPLLYNLNIPLSKPTKLHWQKQQFYLTVHGTFWSITAWISSFVSVIMWLWFLKIFVWITWSCTITQTN